MQNLHHFCEEPKIQNMAAGLNLKLIFCFMEITHEPLHLRLLKSGTVKDHEHTCEFYLNYYFFTKLLDMAMARNCVMFKQTLYHSV
jgi:hypothetical protein